MANVLDKLNSMTDSLGRALNDSVSGLGFSKLVDTPQQQARDWTSLLSSGSGGVGWSSAAMPTTQGLSWGQTALGSARGGLDWGGLAAGRSQGGPFDLSGFDDLARIKAQQAAAAAQNSDQGAVGTLANVPGGTGAGGASAWITSVAPANSPIIPIADQIAQYAVSKGVDPGLIFGKLQAESSWATNGQGPAMNNPGNIMAPGADPANGKIILRQYGSMLEGVQAMVDLLASYNQQYAAMLGKPSLSIEDMVGIYYVGPNAYKQWGLDANDAGGHGPGGNGTVRDYLNRNIYPVMQSYNNRPGAQRAATGGGSGAASIWGGQQAAVTQPFGAVTPGIDQGIYNYGAAYGLPQGHTGTDIGLRRGTQLYMPAGLTGVVETAGGTQYFRDEDYGDNGTPGKGELRIRLSNGDILILGHTSQIGVQVGQQVSAGMLLGLSGSASGDHLHLEVRRKNADGSYTLVDPMKYFGAPTTGGAPGNYH